MRLGRQHVRRGVASIKTEKSGFTVEVSLPILPILHATLDAGPCGDLTFIVGANGRPLTKESFGNEFGRVQGGWRARLSSRRSQDRGDTRGRRRRHRGGVDGDLRLTDPKMAAHYTRTVNRKRLRRAGNGETQRRNIYSRT